MRFLPNSPANSFPKNLATDPSNLSPWSGTMIGKVVKRVRFLTPAELRREGWDAKAVAVEFTDGTVLFASADDEGNDSGVLAARQPDGTAINLWPTEREVAER